MGRLRDFVWRSDFFPRKLSFTREGKAVVLISIGLGLAAVNTGNNLLYLVFGLSLALIVISGILSEANLRHLACRPVTWQRATACEPAFVVLTVESRRRRFPAFSIEAWPFVDDPACRVEPARFLDLRPGQTSSASCVLTFARRGEFKVRGMVLSTGFPFSFFRKSFVTPAPATVLVHPRARDTGSRDRDPSVSGDEASRQVPGRGIEFFGVRDFRDGDNPRHVVHTLSAARVSPVVREFEDPGLRRVWVAVLNVDDGRQRGPERAETAIELAAGLAVRRLRAGNEVGLAAAGGAVSPGTGPAQAQRVLDFLASVPVLAMNGPGLEDQVRRAMGAPDGAEVVWVRP